MSTCTPRTRYDHIRSQRAPAGVKCPHCHTGDQVYFSSTQLRRPLHKRVMFAYLRCHSCTHRFRHLKMGSLVFMGVAFTIFAFAGVIG